MPTVVLVPGITGSTLSYSLGPFASLPAWVNPPVLVAGGFANMRLAIPSEDLPAPGWPVSRAGGPLPYYFGALSLYLLARGWRVASPVGDWRKPQAFDAAALLETVRAEARSGPVAILAHSRGGLLTRRVLAALDAAGERSLVSRVVGMGVPHTGSLLAAVYVSGHGRETRYARDMFAIFQPHFSADYVVNLIRSVSRSWPSVYELMPAPGNPWFDASLTAALYVPATWAAADVPPVSQYVTDALAAWGQCPPVPSWVEWIDVVGSGIGTAHGVPSLSALVATGALSDYRDGDGVVPVESATQAPRKSVTVPSSHSSMVIDPRVWTAVDALLRQGTTVSYVIAGRVLDV